MNVLYSLLLASGTKEALFAAFWLALGEQPGTFAVATFADLAATAERYGVALTDSQTRKRVKELEALKLVKIDPLRERGRFDFSVFAPNFAVSVAETATKAETVAETSPEAVENRVKTPGNKDFAAQEQTETTAAPTRVAPACNNKNKINIKNKSINKKTCEISIEEPQAVDEARSTDDVRAVIDFEAPKVKALRASIAERIWEPTTHPDLIDRLTAAVVLRVGNATESTVSTIIAEANAERARYDQTNGRAGRRTAWQTATLRVKRLFENAGWRWTPTRFADEPRPNRRAVVAATRPQKVAEATAARPLDELRAIAAGFNASELDLTFEAFQALVRDRRQPANAIEANALAFEIRGALRELKNS
jgi:hypothetical protein